MKALGEDAIRWVIGRKWIGLAVPGLVVEAQRVGHNILFAGDMLACQTVGGIHNHAGDRARNEVAGGCVS